MSERKIWRAEQDEILKKLFEEMGVKKWTEVARMMKQVYGIDGRSGKQCRQRYHNHLKGGISKAKWTQTEEELLIELHCQHGNRWAFLSRMIPGRTENCVKNMLYSRMRRSVRLLNKFSWEYFRRTLKLINTSFIYRLIQFTENSYKKEQAARTEQQNRALKLKNDILYFDLEEDAVSEAQKLQIKELIEQIHQFKRANQHFRGNRTARHKIKRNKKGSDDDSDFQVSLSIEQFEPHKQAVKEDNSIYSRKCPTPNDQSQLLKEQPQPRIIKVQSSERNDPSPKNIIESIFFGRDTPNLIMARRDSVESNLFADKGLEFPINMQNPFFSLTPTPLIFNRTREDWTNAISNWKPHISND